MATLDFSQTIVRGRHPLEKASRIQEEMVMAKVSHMATLSYCWLMEVPSKLFTDEEFAEKLKRLDLSHNYIVSLPLHINRLVNLREIWLAHNPLTVFPNGLLTLKRLEVIDISYTKISEVPTLVIDLHNLLTLGLCLVTYLPVNVLTKFYRLARDTIRKQSKISVWSSHKRSLQTPAGHAQYQHSQQNSCGSGPAPQWRDLFARLRQALHARRHPDVCRGWLSV